jgi:hypothetical protein
VQKKDLIAKPLIACSNLPLNESVQTFPSDFMIFLSDCHPLLQLHNSVKSNALAFENNPIPNKVVFECRIFFHRFDLEWYQTSSVTVYLCVKQNQVMSMFPLYYHTITDLFMTLLVYASRCGFGRRSRML